MRDKWRSVHTRENQLCKLGVRFWHKADQTHRRRKSASDP